jgi:hypothetical protein
MWLSLATEQITAEHDIAKEACAKLEAELSTQQIAEARRLVAEWKARRKPRAIRPPSAVQ